MNTAYVRTYKQDWDNRKLLHTPQLLALNANTINYKFTHNCIFLPELVSHMMDRRQANGQRTKGGKWMQLEEWGSALHLFLPVCLYTTCHIHKISTGISNYTL